jgi:O-Antigen ligase
MALRARSRAFASPGRVIAAAGLSVLLVFWPLFVFTGTQASYLASIVSACVTATGLALERSALLVGYLAGLVALVGPEVNGQLGNGHALLGSLRVLDAAAVAGVIAIVATHRRSWRASFSSSSRSVGTLGLLTAAVLAYAALRWAMEGHRVDSFLRSDLRLIALGTLSWVTVTRCRRGGPRVILWSLVVVGFLAAAKASAIHISGVYAIGSYDRLQASDLYSGGNLRTILIGGDTLLILAPAIAVLLAADRQGRWLRAVLMLCLLACMWALGLSATRTSALVALGLVLVSVAATGLLGRPRLSRRALAGGVALALLVIAVALIGGTASRLTHADAPHVGLNFRTDEVKSFLHASAETKYLGQGLGGRFASKDVNGKPVIAGWAHELPVWIALKTGIFGLVCASLALVVIGRRAVDALRGGAEPLPVLAGVAIVIGLVLMSVTLDRVALVEGMLPLMLGVSLISIPSQPSSRSTA